MPFVSYYKNFPKRVFLSPTSRWLENDVSFVHKATGEIVVSEIIDGKERTIKETEKWLPEHGATYDINCYKLYTTGELPKKVE